MFKYKLKQKLNSNLLSVFANLDESCTRIKIKNTVTKFGSSLFDLAAENASKIIDERLPHYTKELSATLMGISQHHPLSFFRDLFLPNGGFCSQDCLYSIALDIQETWEKTAKRSSPKDNSMMMRTAKSNSNPHSYVPSRKRFISEKQSQSFDAQTPAYGQELHHSTSLPHIPHSHHSLPPTSHYDYDASGYGLQQLQSQVPSAHFDNSRYHQSLQMQASQLSQPQMNCLPQYHSHVPQPQFLPAGGSIYNHDNAHHNYHHHAAPQQGFQVHQNSQHMYPNTAAHFSGGDNRFNFSMLPNYDHTKSFLPNEEGSPDTGYNTSEISPK